MFLIKIGTLYRPTHRMLATRQCLVYDKDTDGIQIWVETEFSSVRLQVMRRGRERQGPGLTVMYLTLGGD